MNEEGKEQMEDTAEVLEEVETTPADYPKADEEKNYESKSNGFEKERDEIHSNVVRAGKRTYFFDVKATRNDDYYLTITESKKRFNKNGRYYFEKHKIFLYKEDFEKFSDALKETIDFIKEAKPELMAEMEARKAAQSESNFTDVEFDDLEKNG